MWIFSTVGFFSVVSAGQGNVQVRARDRRDLERLVDTFAVRAAILDTPRADYPCRIVISQRVWLRVALGLARQAKKYTNFKMAAAAVDPSRSRVLHEIWAASCALGCEGRCDDGFDFPL